MDFVDAGHICLCLFILWSTVGSFEVHSALNSPPHKEAHSTNSMILLLLLNNKCRKEKEKKKGIKARKNEGK